MINKTLIVAGATGYGAWPDNSLEGARECLKAPADGIEIDVQLTSDGVVVAHHDYRLARSSTRLNGEWLSERTAPIKAMTFAELQKYDVGSWRPGASQFDRYPHRAQLDDVRVPSLRELFALLNKAEGPKRLFYIEIKTDPQDPADASTPEAITSAVMDEIEAAGYAAHTKIIAFDWKVLRLARERAPRIVTAHLTIPPQLQDQVKRLPDGTSPWTDGCDPALHGGSIFAAIRAHGGEEWSPYYTEVNAETVAAARDAGLKVGPWGLSGSADIRRMVELGVFSATVSGVAWE
jgi:glycerophosphoryl diester phosphodiesterase